jgi:hypothetical protein
MSNKAIRALLEGRLKTWADGRSPAIKVAFQNAAFTKPNALYLRAFMLPNDTDSRFLEGTDKDYMGIFQVSIVAPLNGGPSPAETVVASLEALFPKDLIIAGTPSVRVTSVPSASPALQEPDAYVVPVSFEYQAQTIS